MGEGDSENIEWSLDNQLVVTYEEAILIPSQSLSFGRAADLTIGDDNPYLHRLCGIFERDGGVWWVRNMGSRLMITMHSNDHARRELPPGAAAVIVGVEGVIRIIGGPTTHEIGYQQTHDPSPGGALDEPSGSETTQHYGSHLTPREFDIVLAMSAARLRGRPGIPSQVEIAHLWGIAPRTVNNTLSNLRERLRSRRVRSIDSGERLVEYAVSHGLVQAQDLKYLEYPGGPQSALDRVSHRSTQAP